MRFSDGFWGVELYTTLCVYLRCIFKNGKTVDEWFFENVYLLCIFEVFL